MSSLFFRIFHCSPKQAALAVLIGFIVAVGIGLFVSSQNTPAPSDPSTFTNWQPILNNKWHYSLRIPAAFSLSNKADDASVYRYQQEELIVEIVAAPATSLDAYIAAVDKERATAYEGQPSVTVNAEKNTIVDGLRARERESFLNAAGFPAMETIVFREGTAYRFATLFAGDVTSITDEGRALHRDIVSTVKFGS